MPVSAAFTQHLKRLKDKLPHRYAINAKALGDAATLPWSNLGLWSDCGSDSLNYPQACQALADHLAQSIQLQAPHRLFDVGCGQGASLRHWREHYGINDLTGLELQPRHVAHLRAHLPSDVCILAGSYTDLPQRSLPPFDRIVCIDAAYHLPLGAFLQGITQLTHAQTRVGLHYVMRSDQWDRLSAQQQRHYALLLKAAAIQLAHVPNATEIERILQDYGWQYIEIEDLSARVFGGFARYMQRHRFESGNVLDDLKIRMTAKLCQKLADDGLIRYVQICAQKAV